MIATKKKGMEWARNNSLTRGHDQCLCSPKISKNITHLIIKDFST